MKIREDLIFDKFSGEITGFVDFGDEGLDQKFVVLQQQCKGRSIFEREVATHMLTLMVRGLDVSFKFSNCTICNNRYSNYIFCIYGY